MLYLQYDFLWAVLDKSFDRKGGAEASKGVAMMPDYPAQAEVRTKPRRPRHRLVGMEWFRKMFKQFKKNTEKMGKRCAIVFLECYGLKNSFLVVVVETMQGAAIGQFVKYVVKNGYKFDAERDPEVRSEKSRSCVHPQQLVTED